MNDPLFDKIKENFLKNKISSVCYIMRKFNISSKQARKYIENLSKTCASTTMCEGGVLIKKIKVDSR